MKIFELLKILANKRFSIISVSVLLISCLQINTWILSGAFLRNAARHGHYVLARVFVALGDVDARGRDKKTALMEAAANGNFDIIKLLLAHGADAHLTDKEGRNALFHAVRTGRRQAEIMPTLLHAEKFKAAPTIVDNTGQSALIYALKRRKLQLATCLARAGYGIDIADTRNGWYPLIYAAEYGYNNLVKILLERGADPDATGNRGETALINAAYQGHINVVRTLLEKGADATRKNEKGVTALAFARMRRHDKIVSLFIEKVETDKWRTE